jgi:hypothetical protein
MSSHAESLELHRGIATRFGDWCFAFALAGVFVTAACSPVVAEEKSPFGDAVTLLLDGDGLLPADDRKKLAKGLMNACGDLERKIPSLSPREDDWLDAEINAERIMSVYSTPEFAKRQSRRTLADCRTVAQALSGNLPAPNETLGWSMLISALLDRNISDHVQLLKRTNAAAITDQDISAVSFFPFVAKWIVDRILTPRLVDALGAPAN